jgi:hypothetical protein
MPSKSKLSIHAAVMNCLSRCVQSVAPLCCLGEFLERLAVLGWEPDDVRDVEVTVLKLLGKLEHAKVEWHSGRNTAKVAFANTQ